MIAAIAVAAIIIFALLPVSHIFSTLQGLTSSANSDHTRSDSPPPEKSQSQTTTKQNESEESKPATQIDEKPESSTTDSDEHFQNPPAESAAHNEDPPIAKPPPQSSNATLDELRLYALEQVNKDRADFGLPPVALSDNQAAQVHAEDVLSTRTISHWMTNGEKPYVTYTLYDGIGTVTQNVAVSGYDEEDADACMAGHLLCATIDPREAIDEAEYGMIYDDAHANWGHRDNILDEHHTHVSFGIAYNDYFFAFVQNFENQYVEWDQLATYDVASKDVTMRGSLAGGFTLAGISILYDSIPTPLLYEEHKNDESYGWGEFVAVVVEPPPFGAYYEEPDDYMLMIADEWRISGQEFDFSFSMEKAHERFGDGVYTVIIWANNGEDAPVTNISVVVE